MTYTPETLRKVEGDRPQDDDAIDAHADAWEARERILAQQIERNGRFVASEKALYDEVIALRQRLEAAGGIAEAALKRWKSRPWETTDNAERHMKDILAALAAGEKPCDCGCQGTWGHGLTCGEVKP